MCKIKVLSGHFRHDTTTTTTMVVVTPRTETDQKDLEREIAAALEASFDDAEFAADRREEAPGHVTQLAVVGDDCDTTTTTHASSAHEDGRATPFVELECGERDTHTPDLPVEPVQDLVVEASAQCIDVIETYYRVPVRSWLILLAVAIGVAAVTAAVVRSEVGWRQRVTARVCSQQHPLSRQHPKP